MCDPKLRVVYLLYSEAPTDPELLAALRPVVERHFHNVSALSTALFPELATSAEHRALFDAALFAMQGLSLQRGVYTNKAREKAMLSHFAALAESIFQEPASSARKGGAS
jgi:hypothetical protein